ncbi:MAG: HD domain-containing protein [Emergencia sp.]
MNRLLDLETRLIRVISEQEGKVSDRDETLDWERIHMASSARCAWLLAMERGADPELAACSAAVHDFGRILTGRQKDHAEAGYEPVKVFLRETGLFTEEETEIIATAVKNHSRKTETGTLIEEIVKDADVIDCYQYGYPFDRPEKKVRYDRWRKEHGISET